MRSGYDQTKPLLPTRKSRPSDGISSTDGKASAIRRTSSASATTAVCNATDAEGSHTYVTLDADSDAVVVVSAWTGEYPNRPADQIGLDVFDDLSEVGSVVAARDVAEVWCGEHVGQGAEGVCGGQRFEVEHVQASARDTPTLQHVE